MKKDKPVLVYIGLPGWLQPHKQDRGDLHTEETIYFILEKVREGWTLANICKEHKEMPPVGYVRRWIYSNEAIKKAYFEAQQVGSEKLIDEIIEIADGVDKNDNEIMEDVQRSQLRINARKWLLERWHRERYGSKETASVNIQIDLSKAMSEGTRRVEKMRTVINGEFEESQR